MNQESIVQQVQELFLSQANYNKVNTFLEKIAKKEQIYYLPICQAIQSTIQSKDQLKCYLAAKMAKEAIDQKNLDFMTVFQNTCLQGYEELGQITINQTPLDAANRHFASSNNNRDNRENFGYSFFHLLLESIAKWAQRYPKQHDEITPSKFQETYKRLVQQGVRFPPEFYFKTQQIDVLQELQQQLIQMERQHQRELNLRDLQRESEIENLQGQVQFFQNSKSILEQQLQDFKQRYQKDLQQRQLVLEQKEQQIQLLENKIQQLNQENQTLLTNNQSLSKQIKQKVSQQEPDLQDQLKQLQNNNASLKKKLDIYEKDIEKKNNEYQEQHKQINDLKLKLTVLEKNGSANEVSIQLQNKINQLEENIIDKQLKINSLQQQNKNQSSNFQEIEQKNKQLEVKVQDLEKKCKEQQEQLKQTSPNKVNQQFRVQLGRNQNFFPPDPEQNLRYFQERFEFNEDLNQLFQIPQNICVQNLDSTLYPYQTPEQYYSSIKKQPSRGQLISYTNLNINWKDLKKYNKQLFQIFHVNRTNIIYINQSLFKVAILKQINKVGLEYQINYGIYIKSEDQVLNIKAEILNLDRISKYFILSKKDNLQFSLQQQQQVSIEYCINNQCSNLTESPILQLFYNQKKEQIFLPIPLFSFIEFNQIVKQTFKDHWKKIFIKRSNEFKYNPQILPKYDNFLQISKSFTVINENKLNHYLRGIDELKIVAQFKFLNLQLEGYIKFELIPQNKMIIYAGYDQQKYKQFDSLIENVIWAYQSILQQY